MTRQLTALAVVGILGFALAGNAEACHKKKCGGGCGNTTACVTTATYVPPAACAAPARSGCGHKARKCGGGGGGLCHKKNRNTCNATPVAYNCGGYGGGGYGGGYYGGGYAGGGYTTVAPSGQYMGTPQATGQQMVAPPVPSKR